MTLIDKQGVKENRTTIIKTEAQRLGFLFYAISQVAF